MKILKWFINIVLVYMLILCLIPIFNKVEKSQTSNKTYERAREEKVELIQEKEFDWITIPDTNIDYPIAWGEDDFYYLTHDVYGNESSHGAIYYSSVCEPYSKHTTIIYGHCMRDGSMFNNLHLFKNDKKRFEDSTVIIERKDGTIKRYKPLGVYVTNSNFFYGKLDSMELKDAIATIKEHSVYDIDIQYNDDSDIIVLMTCSYDNEGDRLFVFYISE